MLESCRLMLRGFVGRMQINYLLMSTIIYRAGCAFDNLACWALPMVLLCMTFQSCGKLLNSAGFVFLSATHVINLAALFGLRVLRLSWSYDCLFFACSASLIIRPTTSDFVLSTVSWMRACIIQPAACVKSDFAFAVSQPLSCRLRFLVVVFDTFLSRLRPISLPVSCAFR